MILVLIFNSRIEQDIGDLTDCFTGKKFFNKEVYLMSIILMWQKKVLSITLKCYNTKKKSLRLSESADPLKNAL